MINITKLVNGGLVVSPNCKNHIRLYGIKVPEKNQNGGIESMQCLKTLLMKCNAKVLDYEMLSKNKSGCTVCKLVNPLTKEDLSFEMIKLGYAWTQREKKHFLEDDRKAYLKAENDARAKKIGIWSTQTEEIVNPCDSGKSKPQSKINRTDFIPIYDDYKIIEQSVLKKEIKSSYYIIS